MLKKRKIFNSRYKLSLSFRHSLDKSLNDLLPEPVSHFGNFCRMSSTDFELLLQKVDPLISKKDTKWRQAVPSKHRLAMTLRFLATGDSYMSMQYLFKISNQVIGTIVPEVCEAIIQVLKR